MDGVGVLKASSDTIYQYLNFDRIASYKAQAETVAETAVVA